MEEETEDFQNPVHSVLGYQSFGPHSYGGAEDVERFMQRSCSSSSFNSEPGFLFRPNFDFQLEDLYFENQIMSSRESRLGTGQMRKACSTGDLQVTKWQGRHGALGVESSFVEEAIFKVGVGRYSAEERKERIERYRAKRSQRNFNKTIKTGFAKELGGSAPAAQNESLVTIKAKYGDNFIKFKLSASSGINAFNQQVSKRLELEAGSYVVKYQDDDNDWILVVCDDDLQDYISSSASLGKTTLTMLLEHI